MSDLPPLLLLLAFAVVGGAMWLLGRRAGAARTVRLPRDYFVGLDHVINDRIDRAAEVFARIARDEGERLEIQLALASLFRRRGEVDRAIAIHERLRAEGPAQLRERAAFELARDYSSAGLMDRAEQLFEQLAASPEHRGAALEQLLRIHEQQGDWAHALRIFHELPAAAQAERRREAAHYLCELAEQALRQGERERASILVRQAASHDATLPRSQLLEARLLEADGRRPEALERYLTALEAAPAIALEIVPRLVALAREIDRGEEVLGQLGTRLLGSGRLSSRQLAWLLAAAVPGDAQPQVPELARESAAVATGGAAHSLAQLLVHIGDAGGRYLCEDCGLQSVGWYWRCPKCRSWDSLRPAVVKWADRADLPLAPHARVSG